MGQQEKKKCVEDNPLPFHKGGEVCVCGEDEDSDKKGLGEGERGQWPGSCELHTEILQLREARAWHGLDELSQALNMTLKYYPLNLL